MGPPEHIAASWAAPTPFKGKHASFALHVQPGVIFSRVAGTQFHCSAVPGTLPLSHRIKSSEHLLWTQASSHVGAAGWEEPFDLLACFLQGALFTVTTLIPDQSCGLLTELASPESLISASLDCQAQVKSEVEHSDSNHVVLMPL